MMKMYNRNCWLTKRNPTIKLILLLITTLSVSFIFDPIRPSILLITVFFGILMIGRDLLCFILKGLKPFLWLAFIILVVNLVTRQGVIILELSFLSITQEGVTVGISLAIRTVLIGAISLVFIITTNPVALMTSLYQHKLLSAKVSYAVLTGFRIVQLLKHDWSLIIAAHTIRQPKLHKRRFLYHFQSGVQSIHIYRKAFFALLINSIRRAERIAYSLETRGLGLNPRTIWCPVSLTTVDWFFFAASITFIISVMLLAS